MINYKLIILFIIILINLKSGAIQ